jgi:Cu2+-containing amine oxidase
VNGVKSDNSITNLKVLCVECHSEQPNHGHIKANKLREILEIRRLKSQNGYNRSLFETIDIEDKYIARIKDKDISPTHAEDKFIFNDKTDQRSSSQSISYESGEKETSTVVVKLLKDDNTNDFEDMF